MNNWKDVRAGFPDEPLKLFGAGTHSGTFEYFTEADQRAGTRSRSDYNASEDDNVLVQGVAGDERSLWATSATRTSRRTRTKLKALQIRKPEDGNGVAPTVATAQSGVYKPLARPLFIYAKGSSFKRKEVQAFIDIHLRQREGDRRACAVRAAHSPTAEACQDEFRPRGEGRSSYVDRVRYPLLRGAATRPPLSSSRKA